MNEDIKKILEKIKNTVGENNYKLALAITGHRPGKIRDVSMSSKDGELLLDYIKQLKQENQSLKDRIEKGIEYIKERTEFNQYSEVYPSVLDAREVKELIEILKGDKEC